MTSSSWSSHAWHFVREREFQDLTMLKERNLAEQVSSMGAILLLPVAVDVGSLALRANLRCCWNLYVTRDSYKELAMDCVHEPASV